LYKNILVVRGAYWYLSITVVSVSFTMATNQDPELAKDGLEVVTPVSSKGVAGPVPREGETIHLPNFEHEKALCWKFDLRILPMLAIMYLFNALDKGNLGM
jgi:hypothetical protein